MSLKRVTLETVGGGSCFILRAGSGVVVLTRSEAAEAERLLAETNHGAANGKAEPQRKVAGRRR